MTRTTAQIGQKGYTLIELMLAVAVGSVVLAGAYAGYALIANQYDKLTAYTEVQERGLPTISLLSRDLRMAGHQELDNALISAWGRIDDPLVVTDSGAGCCDAVRIIYDRDLFTRVRVTYRVDERNNPLRSAMFMDIENWDGDTWIMETESALVVDYVEDFQVETSDPNSRGYPQLAELALVLRGKTASTQEFSFIMPDYLPGNSGFVAEDNYYRNAFTASVSLRNLRE